MLSSAFTADDDALYWEQEETVLKSPKWQKVQVEEESLNDSVSMIKMVVSIQKPKSALKTPPTQTNATSESKPTSTSNMVTSQGTTLFQLTKQVLEIKQSHKTMINRLDKLAAQMATLIAQSASPKKCPTRGHDSESITMTWQFHAVWGLVRSTTPHVVHHPGNHPCWNCFLLRIEGHLAMAPTQHGVIC